MVLKEAYGLPKPRDPSPAMALNGGFAYSGGPCGALSGAALAVGLLAGLRIGDHKLAKQTVRRLITQLMDQFSETFGSTDCRVLTGVDLRDEQAHRQFVESGAWRISCMQQVEFVVLILFDLRDDAAWDMVVK
jgi:C_GCAxxG_C_C family probable redox protein